MQYLSDMNLAGSTGLRAVRLALLGAACAWGASQTPAGEPIRFSGRTGGASAQEFDRREPLLPTDARSTAREMARPELPTDLGLPSQSVTPTTGLTRKQAEALDQRRNWMFQSPEAILRQAGKADNDSKSPTERPDDQPKSVAERFLEGKEDKDGKVEKINDGVQKELRDRKEAEERNESNRNRQDKIARAKGEENTTGLEMKTAGPMRSSEERNFFTIGEPRGTSLLSEARDRERQRERDASIDSFKRTFSNPWAQNNTGGGGLVGTGFGGGGGSPATAMGLPGVEVRRGPGLGGLNPGGRPATDFGPHTGFGNFDAKGPLSYGPPESTLRQNEAPRTAPRPIVLEAPKRKF